ncbi:MAG: MMPL family transporter [Propionibacteriaceae bacterium]|nr:MMPL family transporter [Propionibacteriaceae bacterium]
MSTWIYRLAHASWRARRRVVAIWIAILIALGGLAATVGGSFNDEFDIPGAASQEALNALTMTFPEAALSSANVIVLAPAGQKVTDPAIKEAIEADLPRFEELEWVDMAQSPYFEFVEGLISDDETAALINVRAQEGLGPSNLTDAQRAQLVEAGAALEQRIPGSEVHVGGDLFSVTMPHVSAVEAIGVVIAIIVLLIVLGSLRAALMPVISALVGAGASVLVIVIAAGVIPIMSTTLLLALMLALAVGIDYSLFIVSRHRDQLATGMDAEESAARATATAGSAVVVAGATVIVALVGLSVAGIPFLGIMGVFSAVAVAIEVALALTLLPAMLGFAGDRIRPKEARAALAEGRPVDTEVKPDAWTRASRWWVRVITKVPVATIAVVVALLGALTLPAQHLQLALPNSGQNPPGAPDRVTFDLVTERFGAGYNGPLVITGPIVESDDPMGLVTELADEVEGVPGVKLVAMAVPNPNADTALIQVIPTTGPDDPATSQLVRDLQALTDTWRAERGLDLAITGYTAVALDVSAQLAGALLPFSIFVVGLSLVLLTVVFRSLVVPVKAALGYLLSVGSAFGITTLVFNLGWFKEVINLPEAIPVISFLPIILMGILFGLAMDYEIFLTSRMREEYVHGNRTNPTEEGFVHSAKVVVAAAVIMVSVFAFFVPAGTGVIKPIALGLAVGVAIDAFLVRMTLGPAVMKLLRSGAWWLPRWLDRRLPELDAEGEAITHQLSLADWPHPDADHAVHGEGLAAATASTTLFEGIDLSVPRGGTLVLEGGAASRRALTLALTGRLALTAGELKVLGLVLPQQAGTLRRQALWLDGGDPDATRVLARAAASDSGPALIAIDDADRLPAQARGALSDLTAHEGTSLVLAASDADAVADLVGTHRVRADLAAPVVPPDATALTADPALAGGTR